MGYWSWILTAIGCTGIWLAGRNDPRGWLLGVCAQVVWMTYAIVTKQYGFCVSAVFYGYFQGKNYLKWKRREDPATPVAVKPEMKDMPAGVQMAALVSEMCGPAMLQVPADGRCPCEHATYCLGDAGPLRAENPAQGTFYVFEGCPQAANPDRTKL